MFWAEGANSGGCEGVFEVFWGGFRGYFTRKRPDLILAWLATAGGWRKCLDLRGFRVGGAVVGGRESLVAQALISAAYRAN